MSAPGPQPGALFLCGAFTRHAATSSWYHEPAMRRHLLSLVALVLLLSPVPGLAIGAPLEEPAPTPGAAASVNEAAPSAESTAEPAASEASDETPSEPRRKPREGPTRWERKQDPNYEPEWRKEYRARQQERAKKSEKRKVRVVEMDPKPEVAAEFNATLEALKTEKDPAKRVEAVRTLARLDRQASIYPLVQLLEDDDPLVVVHTIFALYATRNPRAIMPISRMQSHEDERVRRAATGVLKRPTLQ